MPQNTTAYSNKGIVFVSFSVPCLFFVWFSKASVLSEPLSPNRSKSKAFTSGKSPTTSIYHPPPKVDFVMEGVGGDGPTAASALNQRRHQASRLFQHYLDKSTPHAIYRWIGTFLIVSIYALRTYYLQGFYIVTYGLGIYILNLLIGFLSPLVDPEVEKTDRPLLPTRGSDEFKPFIRRLPEFKFWYAITKAFCVAFVMTFFSMFDVPVFWPILLCYWLVLFTLTMRRQIMHMIKYKYIPFNLGKQKYRGKNPAASANSPRAD